MSVGSKLLAHRGCKYCRDEPGECGRREAVTAWQASAIANAKTAARASRKGGWLAAFRRSGRAFDKEQAISA
jgi:hypothetical protein